MSYLRNACAFSVAALLISAAPVQSQTLTITSEDGEALGVFDQASVEALGLETVETETPWTDGVVVFEGVPVTKVLAEVGISGRDVTGLAMDDYASSLSAEVIETYNPIIATRMNGTPMTIGNKGPFWIMFDFDDVPSETSIELRSFAVWHLNELEVE